MYSASRNAPLRISGGSIAAARLIDILALVFFLVLYSTAGPGASPAILATCLAAFYALFARAVSSPDRVVAKISTRFTLEAIFLTFSYVIFYLPYQLYLLGLSDLRQSTFVKNSFVDGANKATILATIGMLAFSAGYRFLDRAQPADDNETETRPVTPSVQPSAEQTGTGPSRYFGMLSAVTTSLLVIDVSLYVLAGWRAAGEGRYSRTTSDALGVEGAYFAIAVLGMMIAGMWVYAKAEKVNIPASLIVGIVVAAAFNLRILLGGDRNVFFLFAMAVVGGYFTMVRRPSWPAISAGAVGFLIVYNWIQITRQNLNVASFWDVVLGASERGNSYGDTSFNITTVTLRATVEAVPSVFDYTHGAVKLHQLLAIVPFSSKFVLPYVKFDYQSSGELLRDVLFGSRVTFAPGTNIISDHFIDFGVPGVVVALFLTGLFGKVVRNAVARKPNDPQRVVAWCMVLAIYTQLARYSVDLPARSLVWAMAIAAVAKVLARSRPTGAIAGVGNSRRPRRQGSPAI